MGVIAVIRNHNLSYSVFARWREKFMGKDKNKKEQILKNKPKSKLKQFMEDNTRLKKIIAEQALELERKNEALRKSRRQPVSVIADIVGTTVSPTTVHLIEPGAIAVIRTFLNYFLIKELKEEKESLISVIEKKE